MTTRINLLALLHREERRRRKKIIYTVSILLVVVITICSMILEKIYSVHALKKNIEVVEKEAERLEVVLEKIEELRKEEAKIKKRLNVIDELVQGRFLWAKVMDQISGALPYGAWLGRIVCEEEDILNIEGMAFTNFSVASFAEALERRPQFAQVQIRTVDQRMIQEQEVKRFLISCRIER